jgi:N6-L-threonylcarbamoyladenine synthase
MTDALLQEYGALPIVFAGGVTANHYIRAQLSKKYSAHFAEPVYSCDNAAGTAYLGWRALYA